MNLRFYLGPSGSGKSRRLYENLIQQAMENPKRNHFIIVPDQFTMQTQKDICKMHPRGGILNIDVLSFGRLAHRIFEEIGIGEKILLDDTGKNLMIRRITQEKKSDLKVMQKNLDKIGYIHEIKSCISEFMQYGITEKHLMELINHAKGNDLLVGKLEDLQCIYTELRKILEENYTTSEDMYLTLRNGLVRSQIIRDAIVVFDGFTGFTPLQNLVIEELLRLTQEVVMSFTIDVQKEVNLYQRTSEQHLFYLSHKGITTLESIYKNVKGCERERNKDVLLMDKPVIRLKDNEELAFLEEELFRYGTKVYEDTVENISIHKCNTVEEEVHHVCTSITHLIREKGYRYNEIAVVSGNPLLYAHYLRREFEKYHIPYFLDATKGIQLNPCIEYVKSALEVVIQGYGYEGMFHFLKSGITDYQQKEIDLLEHYVITHGIKRKGQWEAEWNVSNVEDENEVRKMKFLNTLRKGIVKKLSVFSTKKQTVREITTTLYEFVVQSSLEEKLNDYRLMFEERNDFAKEKEYKQIYSYFINLLDQLVALMPEEVLNLKEYAQILYAGFEEIQIGVIPQNRDMVIIGDIERTRLNEVKSLFFIGVNDGIIPKATSSGGIISDMEREFLQSANIEMAPTPRQQMYQQKLYLYLNMTKPSHSLHLSYSTINGEGKSIRPAYLIGVICKLFPKLKKQIFSQDSIEDYIVTKERGLDCLGKILQTYVAHGGQFASVEQEQQFKILYTCCNEIESIQNEVELIMEAAFYEYENSKLSEAIAQMLYGTILNSSVSRLEQYASCAYSYFLKYGLELMERKEFSLEKVDIGNVFHGVLERFSNELEKSNYTWFDFSKETGGELLERAVQQYCKEYDDQLFSSSARNEYAITRIKRILGRTIDTLQYQLKKGEFIPKEFELSFDKITDVEEINISLGEQEKMKLRGIIDRVDTYEDDKQVYVKVIDYKSSQHKLDIVALYHGLQLQLVVYMNKAMQYEQLKNPTKEVTPAAILYYHVNDPLIDMNGEVFSEEMVNQSIKEQLRTQGVVNDSLEIIAKLDTSQTQKSDVIPVSFDKNGGFKSTASIMSGENLKVVSEYVSNRISEIGCSILSGDITVNPYDMEKKSSCAYCNYRSICKYDSTVKGYDMRQLGKENEEEVLERIVDRSWDSNTQKTNKK